MWGRISSVHLCDWDIAAEFHRFCSRSVHCLAPRFAVHICVAAELPDNPVRGAELLGLLIDDGEKLCFRLGA